MLTFPGSFAVRITLLGCALVLSAAPSPCKAAKERCLAIAGLSDIHGNLDPVRYRGGSGQEVRRGGILALSGYIQSLREKYGERFMFVDSGDMMQGTLIASLSQGRATFDALNTLGYSAATIGNHEFDFGAAHDSNDRLSVLKQRIAAAQFPIVNLNIYDKKTEQPIAWPNVARSVTRRVGGVRVGITGVLTEDTPVSTHPHNIARLEFRDPVPLVVAEAKKLRAAGAEFIILLAHMGSNCQDLTNPTDYSSCERHGPDGELVRLLERLPQATVDLAVGGHTHYSVAHFVAGTPTIQSGTRAESLGLVEACIGANGRVNPKKTIIHPPLPLCVDTWEDGSCSVPRQAKNSTVRPATLFGKPIRFNEATLAAVRPYVRAAHAIHEKPAGPYIDEALAVGHVSDMTAEALRQAVTADFGLYNKRAVRRTLQAGKVTFGELFQVIPFDDKLVTVKLTGKQFKELMTALGGPMHQGRGGVSFSGITLQPSSQKGQYQIATASGEPIDDHSHYLLGTTAFLYYGGEGSGIVFEKVPQEHVNITSIDVRHTFTRFMEHRYPGLM